MRFAPTLVAVLFALPAWAAETAAPQAQSSATACSHYGDHFLAVAESGVCVAGGAIAELTGQASRLSGGLSQNQIVFHGALAADARTDTGWGELRGFARVSYYTDSYSWIPDYLFVSLTGSTALAQVGLTDSSFTFLGAGPSIGTLRSANLSAKLVRISATVAPNIKVKIGLETDTLERPRTIADPIANITPAAIPTITTTDRMQPDLVAALSYEPDKGSAQLSFALHRVQSPRVGTPDQAGFAVQFGMILPLTLSATAPADDGKSASTADDDDDEDDDTEKDADTKLASTPTDPKSNTPLADWAASITHQFAWQIAYAKGATLYLGYGTGRFSRAAVDAVVLPNGTMELISGVSAMAYYTIGWFPKLQQNVFGSWSQLNPPSAGIGFNLIGLQDYREARIGTNFVYEPVKNLTFTLEAMAMRVDLGTLRNGIATQIINGTTAYQVSFQMTKTF